MTFPTRTTLPVHRALQLYQSLRSLYQNGKLVTIGILQRFFDDLYLDGPKEMQEAAERLDKIESFDNIEMVLNSNGRSLLRALCSTIEEYFHLKIHADNEYEALEILVNLCPEFLNTRYTNDKLPIFHFTSSSRMLILLATVGMKHGVGAINERGGLLTSRVRSKQNALHGVILREKAAPQIFRDLMTCEPPLFLKEDILRYHLVHTAASVGGDYIETLKFLLQLEPAAVYQEDVKYSWLPIHRAGMMCSRLHDVYKYRGDLISAKKRWLNLNVATLLRSAFEYDSKHPTVGGLFAEGNLAGTRNEKILAIEELIETYGARAIWSLVEKTLSSFDNNLPILHYTIEYAPQYCNDIIRAFPDSVIIRDAKNRLPVHVALENGMKWSTALPSIINANRYQLVENDPATTLPPFALAVWGKSCDLKTIYYLLRKHPDHVNILI